MIMKGNAEDKATTSGTGMLLGAVAGDMIGSYYEFRPVKSCDFEMFRCGSSFTDDTVMTVATAEWLLTGGSLTDIMQSYGRRYPNAGYGGSFVRWIASGQPQPYNSWGNGSAMRVSPVGWAFDSLEATLDAARLSAAVTHNHPEGIKGAQATAACVFLARNGKDKAYIKDYVERTFGYDLGRTCDAIRPSYSFDVSCQGSVPESVIAFLDSTDYESAVRLAVSLGGDADTMAAIAGGIAEAYYGGVPGHIAVDVSTRLPEELADVLRRFYSRFAGSCNGRLSAVADVAKPSADKATGCKAAGGCGHKEVRCGITSERIVTLKDNEIFVFGSNLMGMHGGGAARLAWQRFGAVMGCGVGLQGQSYAIPTMQGGVDTIKPYVDEFVDFARNNASKHFLVTRIGCGIAGFADKDIAPLFAEALGLANVSLPREFIEILVPGWSGGR